MSRNWGLLFGLGLAALSSTACSDIEPGDYVVYRIASTSESLSDGCYYPNGESPNIEDDSSTMLASGTIILYAGVDETFYLDLGSATLDGVFDGAEDAGDMYVFEGQVVDVEWTSPDGTGDRWTTTTSTDVEMAIDGALVTGESKAKTSYKCSGTNCGDVPPSCTITTEFVGTEVEDVDLQHQVQ